MDIKQQEDFFFCYMEKKPHGKTKQQRILLLFYIIWNRKKNVYFM